MPPRGDFVVIHRMNRKLGISLSLFVMFMIGVTILADNNLIPKGIKAIPYYDSVGHFLLFGMLGLIAHYAFNRKRVPVFGRVVPLGPTLAICYAFFDETLQEYSKNRTFDLSDIFFGVLGILSLVSIASIYRNRHYISLNVVASESLWFFIKQLRSVLFAGLFFLLLITSHPMSELLGISRYDWLFVGSLLIQAILIYKKLETVDEAKTIFLFHIIGLVLEIYKTSALVGSWSYPEAGYLKLAGVPLYSGFMYAAVGSYIAYAWKNLALRLERHPSYKMSVLLCALIYLNFFSNHFIYDFRYELILAVFVFYYQTNVYFTPNKREYHMPLMLGFFLIAIFIWIAENIATYFGAWKYPDQIHAWHVVGTQKITSWFLLVIISFIVVAYLKHFKQQKSTK